MIISLILAALTLLLISIISVATKRFESRADNYVLGITFGVAIILFVLGLAGNLTE